MTLANSGVAIVDYGLGNLKSVAEAVSFVGGTAEVTSDPHVVSGASKIILPGVGAFPVAAQALASSGLGEAVVHAAQRGSTVLGICLGMQLLFDIGNEFEVTRGLSLLPGEVNQISIDEGPSKLRGTHIGWRNLSVENLGQIHPLFRGIRDGESMYFVHSYAAHPSRADHLLASVKYGGSQIVAAAGDENVFGVQFHPEKSGRAGLRVIENFLAT